ncbi:TetR/AcrR family transcriptional regulator [Chryseobacterium lactis]|uniref:TetR/AcrR family transcriptional regulator n=1 Tax=Chryseobacterium lactis TaxID=1241981 RepID=A0A3G6RH08_CHRLC|nr:TetR/AcrR family transcriptional regulator [Chryseobacterium lactis]AZA83946.1 TetR/AcrR family transcriptional regulator [Chryseobacterium lactis]AZB04332.1 TetR/AcrR family transcriptional regulator [Chryseobacterium lactis]PNW12503.1 TetR/AcrR family transcriptional regulator [Chryseobacterium lactis]
MKGRPNIFQDNELILKAQKLFWEKGFTATSLADLSLATGAGAGSLYNTFKGGKKELFKKSLQQRREELQAFKEVLEKSEDPVALIKDFFMSTAIAENETHMKGCIVANTLVEMTFVDEELKEEAIDILRETEKLYTSVIEAQQKKGTVKSILPAEILGKYLITFWCGINSLRRIYPDKKILKTQIELQLQLLN